MPITTTNLGLKKPVVGSDTDGWGGFINESLDTLDAKVLDKSTGGSVTGNLSVSGVVTGGTFSGAGTGLAGTAAGLSIGGNAATATTALTANSATTAATATTATNLNGGTVNATTGTFSGAVTAPQFIGIISDAVNAQFSVTQPLTDNSTKIATTQFVMQMAFQAALPDIDPSVAGFVPTNNGTTSFWSPLKTVGGVSLLGAGDVPGVVTVAGTQTLTNKTLASPVITENVQVISANTTAVRSVFYVLTASLTLTLPASPSVGDQVSFANRSGTTTPVIARNGSSIMGLAEDLTLDTSAAFGTLVYADATRGWVLK